MEAFIEEVDRVELVGVEVLEFKLLDLKLLVFEVCWPA